MSLHEKSDHFPCRNAFIDQKSFAIPKASFVWELLSGSPIRRPSSLSERVITTPQARLSSTYASVCRGTSHLYNKWQGLQIVRRYNRAPHDRRPSSRWYWASGAAHQTTNNVYRIVETNWIGMHRKHRDWIPNLENWYIAYDVWRWFQTWWKRISTNIFDVQRASWTARSQRRRYGGRTSCR